MKAQFTDIRPLDGVRAASGLAWWNGRLLVIQDDSLGLALVDPRTLEVEAIALEGAGGPLPKALKPDFEAVVVCGGEAWIFGSGSTERRRRIAVLDASGASRIEEAAALYVALERAIGEAPNIEGAVASGGALRLLHRGAGGSASMVLEVPFSAAGPEPRVTAFWPAALGEVAGVPLTFTDGVALDDGRMVYLAVAEDTPNAVDDGPIVGLALGVWTPEVPPRWTLVREASGEVSRRKAEGLVLSPDGRSAYVVTDPDDPNRPAELGRLAIEGFC